MTGFPRRARSQLKSLFENHNSCRRLFRTMSRLTLVSVYQSKCIPRGCVLDRYTSSKPYRVTVGAGCQVISAEAPGTTFYLQPCAVLQLAQPIVIRSHRATVDPGCQVILAEAPRTTPTLGINLYSGKSLEVAQRLLRFAFVLEHFNFTPS